MVGVKCKMNMFLCLSYGVRRDKTEEAQSIYDEYWDRMCRIMLEGSNALTHINETTDKKVKYKEYVAGELLKKVKIEDDLISFPWIMGSLSYHYSSPHTNFPFNREEVRNFNPYSTIDFDDQDIFHSYVRDMYGVKENEISSIWLRLKKRLILIAPEID